MTDFAVMANTKKDKVGVFQLLGKSRLDKVGLKLFAIEFRRTKKLRNRDDERERREISYEIVKKSNSLRVLENASDQSKTGLDERMVRVI